jgi:hypothetical protein
VFDSDSYILSSMKNFLSIIVLSLYFIAPTQADDIKDFQIEGISVGDNLFDHLTILGETKKSIKSRELFYFPGSKKFVGISFAKYVKLDTYEAIQFSINPETYQIANIGGKIREPYKNNIQKCYKKMEEIYSELKKTFPNASKTRGSEKKHEYNKKAKVKTHILKIKGGQITIRCTDWPEETKIKDGLVLTIGSQEYYQWIDNEAFK